MYEMFNPSNIVGVLISVGVALLIIVLGLVMLFGHGAMMIAGYNTLSDVNKGKINEKAL